MSELIECLDGLTANQIFRRIAKTANGQPFYLQSQGAGGLEFCAAFQAIYDAYVGTIPDDIQLAAQNTLCCGLVDAGIWAKLDTFYVFANGDSPNCLLNWINPGTFDCTAHNAPTFTAWEGITGNIPASAYLNSHFAPLLHGVNYSQNSMSTFVYERLDFNALYADLGTGNSVAAFASQIFPRSAGLSFIRTNSNSNSTVANANAQGFYVATRGAANNHKLYKNSIPIIDANIASTGESDDPFLFLAWNNNGVPANFSPGQISIGGFGGDLTAGEVLTMTTLVEAYMDFLGKGIIP